MFSGFHSVFAFVIWFGCLPFAFAFWCLFFILTKVIEISYVNCCALSSRWTDSMQCSNRSIPKMEHEKVAKTALLLKNAFSIRIQKNKIEQTKKCFQLWKFRIGNDERREVREAEHWMCLRCKKIYFEWQQWMKSRFSVLAWTKNGKINLIFSMRKRETSFTHNFIQCTCMRSISIHTRIRIRITSTPTSH